jgi:hypothetical protein
MRRKGESSSRPHVRTDRFTLANDAWYFTTREGMDVGPFESRAEAEKGCERLLPRLQGLSFESARTVTREFIDQLKH